MDNDSTLGLNRTGVGAPADQRVPRTDDVDDALDMAAVVTITPSALSPLTFSRVSPPSLGSCAL